MAARVSSKPRQSPKSVPIRIPGEPASAGDNSAYREEEERIQLISIVAKLSQNDIDIELAKAPLKAAQDARKKTVGLAKAAGFTAAELKARLDEMNNPARDNPVKFAREERHRKWLGIIQPEQTEIQLGDKVPPEAKDEAHWKAEGYKAGLRQLPPKPPAECAERFVQPWMKEHERGYKETTAANVPGASRLREQAAADFQSDNPEVDVEKAARDLKKSGFMERGEPASPDDGFAATEEELAQQTTRRAVQDAAAGATTGEEVL